MITSVVSHQCPLYMNIHKHKSKSNVHLFALHDHKDSLSKDCEASINLISFEYTCFAWHVSHGCKHPFKAFHTSTLRKTSHLTASFNFLSRDASSAAGGIDISSVVSSHEGDAF